MSVTDDEKPIIKDISKLEIPVPVINKYERILTEKGINIGAFIFWGQFIDKLIDHILSQQRILDENKKVILELETEASILSENYTQNKITEAIRNLQESGFKIDITAKEK